MTETYVPCRRDGHPTWQHDCLVSEANVRRYGPVAHTHVYDETDRCVAGDPKRPGLRCRRVRGRS